VPLGNRNRYIPAPMTAEQVSDLHHDLWMAMVMVPKHKHRSAQAEDDCSVCSTRRYLNKAYRQLPRGEEVKQDA
jgi:hypothetical protein